MSEDTKTTSRRVLRGTVVSDKMDKTVTVQVTRVVKDSHVRKYVRRRKTYKAHDDSNQYKIGDVVTIEESRPMSRMKRWVVLGQADAAE